MAKAFGRLPRHIFNTTLSFKITTVLSRNESDPDTSRAPFSALLCGRAVEYMQLLTPVALTKSESLFGDRTTGFPLTWMLSNSFFQSTAHNLQTAMKNMIHTQLAVCILCVGPQRSQRRVSVSHADAPEIDWVGAIRTIFL